MKQEADSLKIHPLLRLLAAGVALAIAGSQIVGHSVARAINLNYFNDPRVPVSPTDVAGVILCVYLLAIALSGRWRFQRKRN